MNAALTAFLALIQQLMPLLTGPQTAQVTALISGVVTALIEFSPLIEKEISGAYVAVKGIITSLQGVVSQPDQLAALQAFDAQIDAAWNAIETQLDPDATVAAAPGSATT